MTYVNSSLRQPELNCVETKPSTDKIIWLSIIQGWAILLVVIGHVNAFTYSGVDGEMYALSEWIHRFCYSFHMPLFMFVSGGLLYLTRLQNGWTTLNLYNDKFKRLMIPFLFFTIVGFIVKIPVAGMSKSGLDFSFNGFIMALFDPGNGPLKELWFVATLMWLMLLYPVYKACMRNPISEILLLIISATPFLFDIYLEVDGWLNISGVTHYAMYFIGGMLFFKYDLIRFFTNRLWAILLVTGLFGICFVYEGVPAFVTAILGIFMSIGLGCLLKRFPSLFGSFRDHSFQIFLVGIFPQMFVELIIWKRIHEEWMQLPFYVISSLLAIVCGIVMSRTASHLPSPWLRRCFGLK